MIDYGLMIYQKLFSLDALHFGLWEEGGELNLENFKKAQERYTDYLVSLIPDGVKRIIDAGCGTGSTALKLKSAGYDVDCVSPDEYQYEEFTKKGISGINFYNSKFEELKETPICDAVLFSESFQYMNMDKAFRKCGELVRKNGVVIICDYFRKKNTKYYKTCKNEEKFLYKVREHDFKVVYAEDITERVLPTLKLGLMFYRNFGLPFVEALKISAQKKLPAISKIMYFLFKKKINKVKYYVYEHTPEKLDAEKFRENVKYMIYILIPQERK